jgi:hypothetical protein
MPDWLRRAGALGAASLFCCALPWTAAVTTTSCETHACDPSTVIVGCKTAPVSSEDACCKQGRMINETQWVSTRQDANWVSFPAAGTIELFLAGWTDATPDTILSQVDIAPAPPEGPADPDPDADLPDATASDWAVAAGSLAEFDEAKPGFVEITNGTCTPTIARILITFQTSDGAPLHHGPCWQ